MAVNAKKITDPILLAIVEERDKLIADNLKVHEEGKETIAAHKVIQNTLLTNGERIKALEEAAISLGTVIS